MQVKVINQEGKEAGQMRLPKEVFGVPLNPDLLHQVVVSQIANRRIHRAKTKTRAEVRGGGSKPWPQKGTGRARHGSIRSPIWRGGGVVFGPNPLKKFTKVIPKKMKRKALLMALSAKVADNEFILVDDLKLDQIKTKKMAQILKKILPETSKRTLIVLPELDRNIILSARNLPKVSTIQAKDLNALDILSYKYIVMPKSAIKVIKETFLQ